MGINELIFEFSRKEGRFGTSVRFQNWMIEVLKKIKEQDSEIESLKKEIEDIKYSYVMRTDLEEE